MVGKKYLESMLDESDFGAATEMGGLALDKGPEVSLAPEPFCKSIFTSSALVIEAAKRFVSNNFVPYVSLNTKPPILLLLLLQYLQIHISASLNAWVQYQQEGGVGWNRGVRCWKLGGVGWRLQIQGGCGDTFMIT